MSFRPEFTIPWEPTQAEIQEAERLRELFKPTHIGMVDENGKWTFYTIETGEVDPTFGQSKTTSKEL